MGTHRTGEDQVFTERTPILLLRGPHSIPPARVLYTTRVPSHSALPRHPLPNLTPTPSSVTPLLPCLPHAHPDTLLNSTHPHKES
jgi:hypothetical protein